MLALSYRIVRIVSKLCGKYCVFWWSECLELAVNFLLFRLRSTFDVCDSNNFDISYVADIYDR